MAAKKCQPGKVQFSCQASCPCQQTVTGANKQFKCTCIQTEEPSIKNVHDEAHKRKRNLSLSSTESECEDEGYKEQTTLPQSSFSLSSSFDSTSSLLNNNNNQATQTSMVVPTTSTCLIKTPAVYLDVEVGTDDSVTISAPAEVKDKHTEYNRQFSSVIRVSPRKGRKQKENSCVNPLLQQSSTTTTLTSDVTEKEQIGNKSSLENLHNNQRVNAPATKEKRFTIISDLVKKQQENEPKTTPPYKLLATSATVTPYLSPKKQLREIPARPPISRSIPQSPRKASATSKSSRTENTQPATSFTATAKSNTAGNSISSNSGRVQFYDYNSKLAKEQKQAATSVSVKRQRDPTQPTAMEQAELEKERERERQLEALKKW